MDARGTPQGIRRGHCPHKRGDLVTGREDDLWQADPTAGSSTRGSGDAAIGGRYQVTRRPKPASSRSKLWPARPR
jgi:hypothetical protein